jgi:hypothetical protein
LCHVITANLVLYRKHWSSRHEGDEAARKSDADKSAVP